MTRFWDDFPTIKYDLERVQEVILESVSSRSRTITEALSNLANRNGKLLRPGFVVLSARIKGDAIDEQIRARSAGDWRRAVWNEPQTGGR